MSYRTKGTVYRSLPRGGGSSNVSRMRDGRVAEMKRKEVGAIGEKEMSSPMQILVD